MVLEPKKIDPFFFLPQITFLFGGQFILSSEMDLHAGENGFACQRKWICTLAAQKRPADCYFRSPPFLTPPQRSEGEKCKQRARSPMPFRSFWVANIANVKLNQLPKSSNCQKAPIAKELQLPKSSNSQRAPIAKELQLPKSSNCRVTHLMLGAIAPRRDRVVRLQIDRLFWTHNDRVSNAFR